jgi:hypothetical protein
MRYNQERLLTEFVERAHDQLTHEWLDNSTISTFNTRLTPSQMREFIAEFMKLADKYIVANKNQMVPNSRPILVGFHAFPVLDGDVIPDETTPESP